MKIKIVVVLVITLLACGCFIMETNAQDKTKKPFGEFLLNALFDRSVQKELELVPNQKQQLEEVLDRIRKRREECMAELRQQKQAGASEEDLKLQQQKLIDQLEQLKKDSEAVALQILLPHQRKRLNQVTAQLMMRESAKKRQVASGLLTTEMREYLEIDDKQAEKIENKVKKLQARLLKQIKKLRDEASEELMRELTAEQRKKYKELMGDKMDKLKSPRP